MAMHADWRFAFPFKTATVAARRLEEGPQKGKTQHVAVRSQVPCDILEFEYEIS